MAQLVDQPTYFPMAKKMKMIKNINTMKKSQIKSSNNGLLFQSDIEKKSTCSGSIDPRDTIPHTKDNNMKKKEIMGNDQHYHLNDHLRLPDKEGQLPCSIVIDIHDSSLALDQLPYTDIFQKFFQKSRNAQSQNKKIKFPSFHYHAAHAFNDHVGNIFDTPSRVNTFYSNKWPGIQYPIQLADAGFYYRGDKSEVHCFKCRLKTTVNEWYDSEYPSQAHARLNPNCNFVLENGFKPMSTLTRSKHVHAVDTASSFKTNHQILVTKKGFFSEDIADRNDIRKTPAKHSEQLTPMVETDDINTAQCTPSMLPVQQTDDGMNSQLTQDGLGLLPAEPDFKYPQYRAVTARLRSYDKWKYSYNQLPHNLSDAGYFYTGENDIVRCFCCDLGLAEWDPKDDPWVEHARHNPKCWFLKTEKGDFFIDNIQKDWKRIYNPKHAAHDDKLSRIATFAGWRDDIEQTPEILADAGFFYTGEEDIVRCHYCDGGLRHWEPGDVPWEEHARWFPFCKYLIKMKGREYIEEVKRKTEERQQFENGDFNTDPSQELTVIKDLKDLGIDETNIKYSIEEYRRRGGGINLRTEELINIIFDKDNQQTQTKQNPFSAKNNTLDDKPEEKDPQEIREINKKLKEKMKCVRCRTNDICMLFVNCGHRITCENCADNMDFCPVCDTRIKKRIKTFLS